MPPEKCNRVFAELAETIEAMGRAKTIMNGIIEKLYGTERLVEIGRCSNYVPIIFINYQLLIRRDLQNGLLEVRDGNICHTLRKTCVPIRNYLLALDMYYDAEGRRRKLIRELEYCEP